SILTLLGMVLVMVLANWQFTLFSILIGPALFVVVLGYTRSIKATTRRAAKAAGRVAEVAAEDIAAITEVKAFTPAPTATLVHAGGARRRAAIRKLLVSDAPYDAGMIADGVRVGERVRDRDSGERTTGDGRSARRAHSGGIGFLPGLR